MFTGKYSCYSRFYPNAFSWICSHSKSTMTHLKLQLSPAKKLMDWRSIQGDSNSLVLQKSTFTVKMPPPPPPQEIPSLLSLQTPPVPRARKVLTIPFMWHRFTWSHYAESDSCKEIWWTLEKQAESQQEKERQKLWTKEI